MSRKITKEELQKKFYVLQQKLGRFPTRDEFGNREPVKRLYGNYSNFVRELGHFPSYFRNKEDYIKYIKKLAVKLNRAPSVNDLKVNGINPLSIIYMFGSHNNLLKESELEIRQKIYTDKTNEELLFDYINLCNKLGRWATTRELDSIDIYENRFGSIIEVRKIIVVDERLNIEDKNIKEPNYKKYSDEELKKFIFDALKIYGENIKTTDFINYLKSINGPSINTIMKRFKCTSFIILKNNFI